MKIYNILIAAGHSNTDPGAIGYKGLREADLAVELRDKVYAQLSSALQAQSNVQVIRDGDTDGDNRKLKDSILLARESRLAVELHFNASVKPLASGVETLSKDPSRFICLDLCKAVATATGCIIRGTKNASAGQHSRLGFCEAGGIILEVCFITSQGDMIRYLASKNEVARNIANTLASYARHWR